MLVVCVPWMSRLWTGDVHHGSFSQLRTKAVMLVGRATLFRTNRAGRRAKPVAGVAGLLACWPAASCCLSRGGDSMYGSPQCQRHGTVLYRRGSDARRPISGRLSETVLGSHRHEADRPGCGEARGLALRQRILEPQPRQPLAGQRPAHHSSSSQRPAGSAQGEVESAVGKGKSKAARKKTKAAANVGAEGSRVHDAMHRRVLVKADGVK